MPVQTFKLLTWNIRQGGKKAIQQIAHSLEAHGADVVVLSEYKENTSGNYLKQYLSEAGWPHSASSHPQHKENGMLIASRTPLKRMEPPFSAKRGSSRWNEVYIPHYDLFLLGVHVPNVNEHYDKTFHWEHIISYATQQKDNRCVITGDFNTARREEKAMAPKKYSQFIQTMEDDGWTDARKVLAPETPGYTWYSNRKNGYRLDYIFLSPALHGRLLACGHSHHERLQNYSDHAIVEAKLIV
ncbi:endonuclease [Lentibacillus lipolyticus]|nr:endonuclease [Lentibacillus lipolyticus]